MPKMYRQNIRVRIVSAVESGMTKVEASRRYRVGLSTIARWCAKKCRTGDISPERIGRPSGTGKIDLIKLERSVEKDSDATAKQRGKEFGVSDVAILKAMRRLKISQKKKTALR